MSHTAVNLRELPDMAAQHGMGDVMSARFARDALAAEQTGLSLHAVMPGARQAFGHRHGSDEEIYVVLAGTGRIHLDDDVVEVGPMDAVRIAPGVARRVEAGTEPLEFLAFGTHTDDDAEVLPDFAAG